MLGPMVFFFAVTKFLGQTILSRAIKFGIDRAQEWNYWKILSTGSPRKKHSHIKVVFPLFFAERGQSHFISGRFPVRVLALADIFEGRAKPVLTPSVPDFFILPWLIFTSVSGCCKDVILARVWAPRDTTVSGPSAWQWLGMLSFVRRYCCWGEIYNVVATYTCISIDQ